MSTFSKVDFKIPFQLTQTLAAGRNLLSDRGLGLSKKVIEIEVKASQEEMTEASEARARQFMASSKIDTIV